MALSIYRLLAITVKELRHITRDVRIFFLVTLSPAFLLLVLANIFALDAGNATVAWLDYDRTATSRAYRAAITADGTFRITEIVETYQAVETALAQGRVDVALIIPAGFEADLLRGVRPAVLQATADGTDAIIASQFLGNLSTRTAAFGATLTGTPARLETRSRSWYNGELKSLWSMVPGLVAIVLILPSLALTLAVTREGEVGTLEALIASPVRGAEFLLGKLIAYILSGVVSAGLTAAVAIVWFGVPFRSTLPLFLLLTVDFFLACMGVSLLIAQFVPSQQTAMLVVLFVFFVPAFFVAGLIQPVNSDSTASLAVSYALPATHFIAIVRALFLKGTALDGLTFHAGMLALTGLVGTLASLAVFRKRIG